MRRVMLVLAVAAIFVALSVSPAFAEPNPPDQAEPHLRDAKCHAFLTQGFTHIPDPFPPTLCL